MEIITNNQPRHANYGMYFAGSLRQKLLAEFDYLSEEEFDIAEFFNYRGNWYSVGEFKWVVASPHEHLYGWDGYHSDSYFSGIVIKYLYGEGVIVGRYCC
jgi:hypothetical protein